MAALSPAESLFLLNPNRTPARETVKVTLLWLVARGVVRLEERQVTWRFFGTRKAVHVRPAGTGAPALPAHAASLLDQVRAAQAGSGSGGLGSGLRRGRTGREQPAGDQQLDARDGFLGDRNRHNGELAAGV
jgi:hypothetical protein